MKKIFKRILTFSFILISSVILLDDVVAIDFINDEKLKMYDIKEKEEVLVENNKIIDFYEESHENFENLIKEKEEKEKQERISYKMQIVNFATQFVGNPYVAGGTSLTNGTDCSGFVMSVYANFGISLPRTAPDQSYVGEAVSIEDIEPGDIVSYGYNGKVGHSALYIGDGLIVHAATPELGIRIDGLYMMPIITIRRVI